MNGFKEINRFILLGVVLMIKSLVLRSEMLVFGA